MQAKNKTYYYNVVGGVRPSDHDITYSRDWCDGEVADYYIAQARLEVKNPKTFGEYQESPNGHYIEGVNTWADAHDTLVDLVQAMLVECVGKYGIDPEIGQYNAYIEDTYKDCSIEYSAEYYARDGVINITVYTWHNNPAHGKILSQEALDQMLCISVDDLNNIPYRE